VTGARSLAALALCALALAGCGRADFDEDVPLSRIEQALEAEGVAVCASEPTEARTPGAVAETRLDVARDCADPEPTDAVVVVTTFDDAGDRDAAAGRFEVAARPVGAGAVWTLGPHLVRVSGDRDPETSDRIADALDGLGAR
jgi:hypothetical protein